MSKVHVSLHRDAAHGKAAICGPMRFAPSRRRSAGIDIILPAGFDVDLVDGEAVVDLDATGPDWCWCAYEPTLRGAIRSVLVPEAGDDEVLEYEGLTDVDPNTLEPSPEALAGWTATLNEVRELRNDAVATIPLLEPIPGIASAVHADAEAADAAAEQAGAQATQAGQHRQAVEQVVTGVLPGIEAAKADAVQTVEQTGAGILSEMSGLRDTMVVGGEVAGDVLRLTRADGSTVDAGDVRGQAGADGVSATLELSAQTGEPGTEVVVDNLGTPQAANYRLTIPRGATGSAAPWMRLAAGRPDTPGTLDPDTLAWRNAAPSGSTFYSSDGPQGAWVWRKRGALWVCVEGNTGLFIPDLVNGWVAARSEIQRIDSVLYMAWDYLRSGTDPLVTTLPLGFRPSRSTYLRLWASGTQSTLINCTSSGNVTRTTLTAAPNGGPDSFTVPAESAWPITTI